MSNIAIIPAKVMREFRRFLIENNIETPDQMETALKEGHERICVNKEKAQPVRVELERKQ